MPWSGHFSRWRRNQYKCQNDAASYSGLHGFSPGAGGSLQVRAQLYIDANPPLNSSVDSFVCISFIQGIAGLAFLSQSLRSEVLDTFNNKIIQKSPSRQ